ncbi:MAG: hypothetical protein AAGF11_21325 [Myxococcota bacterium]
MDDARCGRGLITIACWLAACATADRSTEQPAAEVPVAVASSVRTVEAEPIPTTIEGPSYLMPRGLTSFGAAPLDGSLYILGGYFGRPHDYSEAGQSGELLRLDLKTNQWTRLGDVDKAQSVTLVAHEGRLYRVGGMQARNAAGSPEDLHSLDTVEVFDVATSAWSTLPSLPQPRSSHEAIVADGKLWVVGGWTLAGESRTWHTTILSLDLADPSKGWTEIDAPFQRRALAAAAIEGKIVVMGGLDSERQMSTSVDIYDSASGQWSTGPQFAGPGFGLAAAVYGGTVFGCGMDGVIHRWQPGESAWVRAGTLAYPRFFHRMVPTGSGELLVVGGIRHGKSGKRVRPIERIPVQPAAGEPTMLSYALPSPLPSKNRQGVALEGDTLFFFGGNKSLGQHDFEPKFFTDEGQALNLASMEWRPIAPYPEKRQTMSTFVTKWGHVVSVGGFGHDGEVARSHPEIFAYDPGKDAWKQIGQLPAQGRTQFGLAVRSEDKEVVLFGGLDFDPRRPKNDQFRHELELLRAPLSPSGMNFEGAGIELREPRRAFAGQLLGDRYYVVGGMKEGFSLVDTCEAYDFGARKWETIACPNHARLSAQMVAMGGKLYLAAGSSKVGTGKDVKLQSDPSLEVYDPETNRWTMLVQTLPIEPKHMRMLAYRDRLVLVSTHNDDGVARLVLLDPAR